MWVSPRQRVWAYKNDDRIEFCDEGQRARHQYDRRKKTFTKLPLGEETVDRILPLHDLSADGSTVGHWMFGTEKIVDQKRRELTVDGKRWIEFDLVFSRGEEGSRILRVDPDTRLPVSLSFRSHKQGGKPWKWAFDYPERGPNDIYEMGVPRDAPIEDRMPSYDARRVLDSLAANRRRIGDFRVVIAEVPGSIYLVWRKGDRWRVDWQPLWEANRQGALRPEGQTLNAWFEQLLRMSVPWYRCDGKSVYKNAVGRHAAEPSWEATRMAPQELLSGGRDGGLPQAVRFAQILFPDLTPIPGFGFEFDPRSQVADGRVLIRVSARLATHEPMTAHEWYFIDSQQGPAVVLTELFNLPAGSAPYPTKTDLRQTIRVEDLDKSPAGGWYPKLIRNIRPGTDGRDENGKPRSTRSETTIQYHFDFDAELPDSLFTLDAPV